MKRLMHGSLFSGIGGFDLAAEWMGWENVFHCEWNEFGKKILNHYWPKAISYDDITQTDFSIHRGEIDILTGGFPCQPYSSAGKRLGTEDDRHLWPEMLRAIREIKPRYIVGENVFGIVNWNGGLVFNEVQTDLEAEGYKVQPVILPACAVNAPHRRDRVWFVAYTNECTAGSSRKSGKAESDWSKNNDEQSSRGKQAEQHNRCSNVLRTDTDSKSQSGEWMQSEQREISEQKQKQSGRNNSWMDNRTATNSNDFLHKGELEHGGYREEAPRSERINQQQGETQNRKRIWVELGTSSKDAPNPSSERLQGRELNGASYQEAKEQGQQPSGSTTKRHKITDWNEWPTESPICSGDDGLSEQLDGITFPKWRQESIKAYGNAIVPQVAHQIFKAIMIAETKLPAPAVLASSPFSRKVG